VMQGIEAGIETFEAEWREGALPVECDHAGNGAMRKTPILTDAVAPMLRYGIATQKRRDRAFCNCISSRSCPSRP